MPEAETLSHVTSLRILHADPAREVLETCAQELRSMLGSDVEIRSFTDGEAAATFLLFAPEIWFDVAIIDAGLQDPGNAAEVLYTLRDCDPECPVILTHGAEDKIDSPLLGRNVEHLAKPFRAEQLTGIVKSFLKCRQVS